MACTNELNFIADGLGFAGIDSAGIISSRCDLI